MLRTCFGVGLGTASVRRCGCDTGETLHMGDDLWFFFLLLSFTVSVDFQDELVERYRTSNGYFEDVSSGGVLKVLD